MNFTKLKDCLDKLVEAYNTPGVDCIVHKDHEMVFRYYTGMRDIENNIRIDGNELYLIFSMTKMITCTAALQLFEQGRFSMEDPLSKYIPEFERMKLSSATTDTKSDDNITTGGSFGESAQHDYSTYAKNPIRIIDLFTMRAGLDYALNDEPISNAIKNGKTSTREIVGAMSEKILCFEPGTQYKYSLCHDVLGALIEIWSGEKFGEYIKNHILKPLGMTNTFFGVPKDEARLSKMAARYIFDENKKPYRVPLQCVYNICDGYESGGAGLTSCTEDYALFLDALSCGGIGKSGEKILNTETVKLMGTNQLQGAPLEDFSKIRAGYGYGLGVRTHIDKSISGSLSPIGEFGWDGSAGAFSLVDTENKVSLAYFQHIHNWDIKIQTEIRNALYQCLG